jgi:excisionase family DNA binding protein
MGANGAAEWAYGVKPWFEQGLYLPVYSFHSTNQGATINGFKIRELFVRPNAHDRKLFYGLNFEFSVNARYWESRRITSELRPIIGVHLRRWDLIYNQEAAIRVFSPWLTANEAGHYLKVSSRTVIRWAREGRIKGHRLSGHQRVTWRFLQSDLDAMLSTPSGELNGRIQ